MIVRPEHKDDIDAIRALTETAFKTAPHADGTEHLIIDRLRAAGVLTLSLVADADGVIVGHVAFSPVAVSDGSEGWYGLGPVSVSPSRQRGGIGSALINEGLTILKGEGAQGFALAGDPAYYRRFGFAAVAQLQTTGVPPEFFLVLPLHGAAPSGIVAFHPAFFGDAA